jgi:hypothetical protein
MTTKGFVVYSEKKTNGINQPLRSTQSYKGFNIPQTMNTALNTYDVMK